MQLEQTDSKTPPAAGKVTLPTLRKKPKYSLAEWSALVLAFLLPALEIAGKAAGLSFLEPLNLQLLPGDVQRHLGHVIFAPLGALLVVFFRLTLGIRLLGPFRSILLAIAFQVTGILLGLIFMALVIAAVVILNPVIKRWRIPYFGRVSALLSIVAALMIAALLLGLVLETDALHAVAFFPLVVLCLTADGFAKTLRRESLRSAMWRGTMTALVAVLLTGLAAIPGLKSLLLRYPELLLAQVGCIVLVSRFFAFRQFQHLNPKPPRKKKKRRKRKKRKALPSQSPGGDVAAAPPAPENKPL